MALCIFTGYITRLEYTSNYVKLNLKEAKRGFTAKDGTVHKEQEVLYTLFCQKRIARYVADVFKVGDLVQCWGDIEKREKKGSDGKNTNEFLFSIAYVEFFNVFKKTMDGKARLNKKAVGDDMPNMNSVENGDF